MFVDTVKVFARAGHGGPGCVAFHREAYNPKGGPSGGDGGKGGDVILEADSNVSNLIAQYYSPRLIAGNGQPGMGKGKTGASGKDLVIKVPCGTLAWRLLSKEAPPEEDEAQQAGDVLRKADGAQAVEIDLSGPDEEAPSTRDESNAELIADLVAEGDRVVLCHGGRGGKGNRHFATATRQAPRFAQPGEPGEESDFRLELRLIAEVGLVGYPNAGKSTLLSAISRARPKIAAYPFTTLHPQVGIVEYGDYSRLTVCDVPGLIEGASHNVGLGDAFLRHITRCKTIVLLLDMAGTDGRAPWDDYDQLLKELEAYDPALLDRPRVVVANKMDEPDATSNLKEFEQRKPGIDVLSIAAAFDEGLDRFKERIRQAVASRQDLPISHSN